MKKSVLCLVAIAVVGFTAHAEEYIIKKQCPPWFFFNSTTKECECYQDSNMEHIVKCTQQGALLKLGYCMTYEGEHNEGFFVGLCNYFKVNRHTKVENQYIRLPSNVSQLNDYMCAPLNRKGELCSQCIDGFGHSVTSIGYKCANCTDVWYGVPLYLFLELVPITVLYFIILLFHISLTSAPMVAFVFYCQIAVSTFLMVSNRYIFDTSLTYNFLKVLTTLYGICNLDFFRFIIPPLCISLNLKAIHITFLYYISAFYPLFLITISWICILLYSKNFKPIVWLWRILNRYFYKGQESASNTMIDVFATFFLLSYAKITFACFRTLSYGTVVNAYNFSSQQIYIMRDDPSVLYFSKQHLPFAIMSIFVLLLAVLPIPLVLTFYPVRVIRLLLFKCHINGRHITATNIFVEKFYNCYRDGLDGGRDMRGLVSTYFFLRLIINFMNVYQILNIISFTADVILYAAFSLLISLLQPYKKTYMNVLDALILANMAMISFILDKYSVQGNSRTLAMFYLVSGSILCSLPLLVLTGVLLYWSLKKLKACCCKIKSPHLQPEDKDMNASVEALLDNMDDPEVEHSLINYVQIQK